ncbi:hypothetical protein [Arenivirga flava]|nr:hypothetical protein [Arenivirga flava]
MPEPSDDCANVADPVLAMHADLIVVLEAASHQGNAEIPAEQLTPSLADLRTATESIESPELAASVSRLSAAAEGFQGVATEVAAARLVVQAAGLVVDSVPLPDLIESSDEAVRAAGELMKTNLDRIPLLTDDLTASLQEIQQHCGPLTEIG